MKDSIVVDGKEYISVRRAAEITRYSKDYIGQLCRSAKIDAVRPGRNWWVGEASLLAHKKISDDAISMMGKQVAERAAALAASPVAAVAAPTAPKASASVEPIPLVSYVQPAGAYPPIKWSFSYESDERPLLPELKKESVPAKAEAVRDTSYLTRGRRRVSHIKLSDLKLTPAHAKQLAVLLLVLAFTTASAFAMVNPSGFAKIALSAGSSSLAAVEQAVQKMELPAHSSVQVASIGSWWQSTSGQVVTAIRNWLGIGAVPPVPEPEALAVATSTPAPVYAKVAVSTTTVAAIAPVPSLPSAPVQALIPSSAPTQVKNSYTTIYKTDPTLASRVDQLQGDLNDFKAFESRQTDTIYESMSRLVSGSNGGSNGGSGGASGSVTSIDASGGTTGLGFTGGPVTGAGTLTLGGTLGTANGGTGTTTYSTGEILYGDGSGSLAGLYPSSNGLVLKLQGGVPTWAPDISGGGGAGAWATTSDNLAVYPSDPAQTVIIGSNATTSTGNIFEVVGNSKLGGTTNANSLIASTLKVGSLNGVLLGANGAVSASATSSLGLPQFSDLASYLTTASAASTYLTSANAASTYLSQANFNALDKGYFFSTTSASYFLAQNLGSAFSTTSADYWKTQRDLFSTTSSQYFLAQNQGNAFSTTSAAFWLSQLTTDSLAQGSTNKYYSNALVDGHLSGTGPVVYSGGVISCPTCSTSSFSTTSADYWKTQRDLFSTTSAAYFLSQNQGNAFSTTSVDYWKAQRDLFSTTSSQYFLSQNQGGAFSTTSSAYFLAQNQGGAFSTTSADAYVSASSTIAHPAGGIAGNVIEWDGSKWVSVSTSSLNIASGVAYAFGLAGNSTSTLTQFNGGLTAYASSTIGNGLQAGGLTVSGGATTTKNAYFASSVGVGTTSPWRTLSVAGSSDLGMNALAGYFTATSATASQLPYASSTALTVSGAFYGPGLSSCSSASSALTWNGGVFGCNTITGGGASNSPWSTTTSQVSGQLVNFSNNSTDILALGSNSTTTAKFFFDPNAQVGYFSGSVGIGTTSPTSALSVVGENVFINNTSDGGGLIFQPASGGLSSGFSFNNAAGDEKAVFGLANSDGGFLAGSHSGDFNFRLAGSLNVLTGNSSYLQPNFVFTADGKLGIGTTSPSSLLSIGDSNGISFSTATSTFWSTGGINLTGGCFAINGVCLASSAGGSSFGKAFELNANGNLAPTTTKSLEIAGADIYLSNNHSLYLNGYGDGNWQFGMDSGSNIDVYGSGSPGGRYFQVVNHDDPSVPAFRTEILTGNSQFRGTLAVLGASTTLQSFTAVNATTTNATTTSLAASVICLTGDCRTAWPTGILYPFALSGNATSTLTQFNGGLTAYASSTVGNGLQAGGLTVSGGATTTGSLSVNGSADARLGFFDSGLFFGMATGTRNYLLGANYRGTGTPLTGADNFFVGNQAGSNTTSGFSNIFLGSMAGAANTVGDDNIFQGAGSGSSNTTGRENVFLGDAAGCNNTTGAYNIIFGYLSGCGSATGLYEANVFIGAGVASGSNGVNASTTAVGYGAGYKNAGNLSTLLGYQAGYDLASGNGNIAIGQNVDLASNTGSSQLNIGNLIYGTGLYAGSTPSSAPAGGSVGIGTTSPWRTLSVAGSSDLGMNALAGYFTATSTSVASTFPYASTTAISAQTICLTGDVCRTTWPVGGAAYAFGLAGNATSTLTQFNGGLTAYASSTVGNGLQAGGLTVSGGATTTGNAYFASSVGIGTSTPFYPLSVQTNTTNSPYAGLGISNAAATGYSQMSFVGTGKTFFAGVGNASETNLGVANKYFIYDYTDSKTVLALDSSGNLGLGTTSPYAKLSVDGRGIFNQDVRANYFTATSTSVASTFPYASSTAFTVSGALYDSALSLGGVGVSSTGLLYSYSTSTWRFASSTLLADNSSFSGANAFAKASTTLLTLLGRTYDSSNSAGTAGYVLMTTASGVQWVATSTLSTISGTLGVSQGGTGATAFGQGWIYSSGGTGALAASTSPTIAYLTATSTSRASTFPYASTTVLSASTICLGSDCRTAWPGGGSGSGSWSTTTSSVTGQIVNYSNNSTDIVSVGSNSTTTAKFFFDPNAQVGYFSGSVGIGTTSPWRTLSVAGNSDLGTSALAGYFIATSSTPSQFAGGFLASASSTIGNGTQMGGLTINGGATTTGTMYFAKGSNSILIGTTSSAALDGIGGAFNIEVTDAAAGNVGALYDSSNSSGFANNAFSTGPLGAKKVGYIGVGGSILGQSGYANRTFLESYSTNGLSLISDTGGGDIRFYLGGASNQAATFASNGSLGIGTTSPWRALSVAGSSDLGMNALAGYFTATSTTASQLPYASSTALTAASLYSSRICLSGDCRTAWPTGAGGAAGTWSTTTSSVSGELVNYSNNNSDVVSIGSNSTTTAKFFFDPNAQVGYFSGSVGIGTAAPNKALEVSEATGKDLRLTYNGSLSNYVDFEVDPTGVLTISPSGFATHFNGDIITHQNSNIYAGDYTGDNNAADNAYAFLNDTGSGIYNPALHELGFSSNGVEQMRLNSLGYLGIGTTSPYAKLSVVGQVVAQYFTATDTAATSTFAGDLSVGNAGAPGFVVDYTGNVGVGTSTPFALLSAQGSSTSPMPLFALSSTTGKLALEVAQNGTIVVNTPGATSTVNGNLYVNGTLRGTNVYSGDLVFANDFRFTEADPKATSTPSGLDGLYLKNRDMQDLLSVDKNGNLTVTGDICSNGTQCYGKSISDLAASMQALASSSQLASGAAQSALSSASSAQSSAAQSYSQLTVNMSTAAQNISDLSSKIDALATTTEDLRLALAQATSTFAGELASSTASAASSTASILATSTSFIETIAAAVRHMIESTGEWVIARLTAKVVIADRVETQVAAVSQGFEMTDQANGQVYCVTLRNGDFAKALGACGAVATSTQASSPIVAAPVQNFTVPTAPAPAATGASSTPPTASTTQPSVPTATSSDPVVQAPASTSTPSTAIDPGTSSGTVTDQGQPSAPASPSSGTASAGAEAQGSQTADAPSGSSAAQVLSASGAGDAPAPSVTPSDSGSSQASSASS